MTQATRAVLLKTLRETRDLLVETRRQHAEAGTIGLSNADANTSEGARQCFWFDVSVLVENIKLVEKNLADWRLVL